MMKMSDETFAIADLHLGHERVIEFEAEARPFKTIEEHDDELIYRWNNTVRKKDTVIVAGDVAFGVDALKKLALLNGVKKLIMGNHDHYPMREYLKYFSQINAMESYKNYLITHILIHPTQFRKYVGNVHGHLHSGQLDDPRYICISAEHINLTPKLFKDIINESGRQ